MAYIALTPNWPYAASKPRPNAYAAAEPLRAPPAAGAGGLSGASENTQATVVQSPLEMACAAYWIIVPAVAPPEFMLDVRRRFRSPIALFVLTRSSAVACECCSTARYFGCGLRVRPGVRVGGRTGGLIVQG